MSIILTEKQAMERIMVLTNNIQDAYKEIRQLSDKYDIAVYLEIPTGTDVIDANYNVGDWHNSDWQYSNC